MRNLRMLWARVKGQALQGREDEAFDDEVREHMALLEERYRAQGMSAPDAARAARLQFGNVTTLKERQRTQRGILSPADWWRDVRFGARMLAKRPASSAAVVLALALGIGMNAAVFTFVNALLLRPPQGVSATNSLVEVFLHNPKGSGVQSYLPFNYPDYAYFRDHTKALEGLMAFDGDGTPGPHVSQRDDGNRAGRGDAGDSFQAVPELTIGVEHQARVVIFAAGHGEVQRQDFGRIVTGGDVEKSGEAADQKARDDEQDDGKGEFGDDQQSADVAAASPGRAGGRFQ